MKKKILSGLIIGAFVFGVGAANVQPVDAASLDKVKEAKEKYDKAKDAKEKFDKARDMFGGKNSGDTDRPTPPTDENGNPMAPPDKNSDGNSNDKNLFGKAADAKDKYDKAKELFKK